MEVFPFFLLRVCGQNYELLSELGPPAFDELFKTFLLLENQKESSKVQLCDSLLATAKSVVDKKKRMMLINLRREIYNEKLSLPEDLEEALRVVDSVEILTESLQQKIKAYLKTYNCYSNSVSALKADYAENLEKNKKLLKQISNNEALRKGLLLSSLSLFDNIEAYANSDDGSRKKDSRTEVTLYK